jgi:hypothetical protein
MAFYKWSCINFCGWCLQNKSSKRGMHGCAESLLYPASCFHDESCSLWIIFYFHQLSFVGSAWYRDVRASTLEQSLRKLGVERLSKEDVQKMQWEALEGKIVNWNQYMRIAVSFFLPDLKKILLSLFSVQHVFFGLWITMTLSFCSCIALSDIQVVMDGKCRVYFL